MWTPFYHKYFALRYQIRLFKMSFARKQEGAKHSLATISSLALKELC
jgi:hypothetical protein